MAKRGSRKQDKTAPPESPEQSPEQAQGQPGGVEIPTPEDNKKETIAEDDAPAGGEQAEPGAKEEPTVEELPAKEPVAAKPTVVTDEKEIAYGLHDGYCVVDRMEFAKLIKTITYGHPIDAYGIMAIMQKAFHLPTWEDAKKVTDSLLKG